MRWNSAAIGLAVVLTVTTAAPGRQPVLAVSASAPAILLEGTIVTMNAEREVIQHGSVLVRDSRIAAVWKSGIRRAGST